MSLGNRSSLIFILLNLYEQLGEPVKAIEQLQAFLKESPAECRSGKGCHREPSKTISKKEFTEIE